MLRFKAATIALFSVVGTVPAATISVSVGLNPIAIPSVPSLNYNITNIFSTPVEDEIVYRWDASAGVWLAFRYVAGAGWEPSNPTFTVGEGVFYHALAAQTFVANLHDNLVPQLANYSIEPPLPLLPNRYYFQGSPTGQNATYEAIFGAAPPNETALFRFIRGGTDISPTGGDYRVYYYTDGVWAPETPVLDPLEPAFVIYPYLSLKYTVTGDPPTINFSWPSRGKLEEAPLLAGPWQVVDTAGNRYSITPTLQTNSARYYRVKE